MSDYSNLGSDLSESDDESVWIHAGNEELPPDFPGLSDERRERINRRRRAQRETNEAIRRAANASDDELVECGGHGQRPTEQEDR